MPFALTKNQQPVATLVQWGDIAAQRAAASQWNLPLTLSASDLTAFTERIALAAGIAPAHARLLAESLVAANLRGVDSHGLQQLPFYVDQLAAGRMQAATIGRVVSESGACLLYDGENGIGQAIAAICCDHALRLARGHGVAIVVARESNHYGAAAFWALRLSAAGMIGVTMCNASPRVAPWQGKDPRLGTNPVCMSVPGARTWLLDMATTTVALGKVIGASEKGLDTLPPGWAMDGEGVPTTSTDVALRGLLMPLGGYKGSGLAMMAEILCAVLGGGAMATELGDLLTDGKPRRISQIFLAIDVSRFLPVEQFSARMQTLASMMKSSRPAAGYDEVLVAGDPEWRMEEERLRHGIPLADGLWTKLTAIAERFGVTPPVPAP